MPGSPIELDDQPRPRGIAGQPAPPAITPGSAAWAGNGGEQEAGEQGEDQRTMPTTCAAGRLELSWSHSSDL